MKSGGKKTTGALYCVLYTSLSRGRCAPLLPTRLVTGARHFYGADKGAETPHMCYKARANNARFREATPVMDRAVRVFWPPIIPALRGSREKEGKKRESWRLSTPDVSIFLDARPVASRTAFRCCAVKRTNGNVFQLFSFGANLFADVGLIFEMAV